MGRQERFHYEINELYHTLKYETNPNQKGTYREGFALTPSI